MTDYDIMLGRIRTHRIVSYRVKILIAIIYCDDKSRYLGPNAIIVRYYIGNIFKYIKGNAHMFVKYLKNFFIIVCDMLR